MLTLRGQGELALRRCCKRGCRGEALLRAGKEGHSLAARHKLRVKVPTTKRQTPYLAQNVKVSGEAEPSPQQLSHLLATAVSTPRSAARKTARAHAGSSCRDTHNRGSLQNQEVDARLTGLPKHLREHLNASCDPLCLQVSHSQ